MAAGTQQFFGEPRLPAGECVSVALFQLHTRERRRPVKSWVDSKQAAIRKQRRRDQVYTDPADTASPKLPAFHQIQCLFMGGVYRSRKLREISRNLTAEFSISARKFTPNERMHENHAVIEKLCKTGVAFAKVFDPDGTIDQHRHGPPQGAVPLPA